MMYTIEQLLERFIEELFQQNSKHQQPFILSKGFKYANRLNSIQLKVIKKQTNVQVLYLNLRSISMISYTYQSTKLPILFYLKAQLSLFLLLLGRKIELQYTYRLLKHKNIYIDKTIYDQIRAKENDSAHPNQNCIAQNLQRIYVFESFLCNLCVCRCITFERTRLIYYTKCFSLCTAAIY